MTKKLLLSALFSFSIVSFLLAASPPNLVNKISLVSCNCAAFPTAPDAYFNTNTQITTAFNFARLAEEAYFGISNGAFGQYVLPSNYCSQIKDSFRNINKIS